MKNPQFLPNQADILPSEFIHWTDILSKFRKNWTKIVDFLVIAFDFQGWTFFWIWSQCETESQQFPRCAIHSIKNVKSIHCYVTQNFFCEINL